MKRQIILIILTFILSQFSGFIHGAIPDSERAALIALYNTNNGDSWINNSGWKTQPLHTDGFAMPGTEGSWYGVIISSDHVRELILVGNQLRGGIPAQLDNLIYLENFELEGNPMSDSIPAQVNKNQLKEPLMHSYKLPNDAASGHDILISGAKAVLPDLVPFQPSGWTDKVVVSNVSGTNTDNIIYANQVVYIDYSVANAGNADITGGFWVEIWDDTTGGLVRRGYWSSPLLAQYYFRFLDHLWLFSSAGWHTIRLKIDADNNVYESNEGNNQYTRQIYVNPTLPTVTTESVYSITTNSAFCGGNVLIDGGVNVIARGVCWSTSSNPTISNSRTTDGNGTGSFTSYISGLNPGTMYYVRAYATNSAGTAYGSNVSFTTNQISTTIPTVSTNTVSSITSNSAVCGGNVTSNGGATVTTRGVCWSTSSNPTTSNAKTIDGSGAGVFTSYISGLNPSTTYYVRAYATNSNGTSYGSNVSFTTNSASTIPTVTTNSVSSITSTSAVCGGNVISDGGATVTARGVCWSTSSNPTTSNARTIDGSGTGAFTSYISGLNPSTTYYVRAYAINSNGTSYGYNVIFATNSTSTTPIVTTNSVSSITSNSAVCGGNVISDGGTTVTARGVCWSTSSNPTTSNARTTDGSGTGSFTSYISGLNPSTTYYVRAYATNSNGTSYGSNVSFITNSASTTPTVTTSSVSSITSNSAVCGGNVTSDGGATVTDRGVCWNTSTNPTIDNSKTNDGSGTGSYTSNITGLAASTTYYIRAYATNSKGTSYGSNVSFTTNPTSTTTPTVSTNPVSSITSNSAVCGGNVTSDGGATVTARGVCWNTSSNPTTSNSKTTDVSGTGIFISYIYGLNPGTTYYVRAYATNSNGTSYGSNVSFTTNTASTTIASLYGTPTSGNAPLTVQFYDQSQPGEGASITNWYWDFGDGTTASGKNPTHTYNNPGIYDVKLTVQNSSGYEDSEIKNNYITVTNSSSTPTADFSGIPTSGSAPLTVQFYDQSIPGSGATVTSWEWEFGDGSTSFHKNPTHTYTSQGTYTVKLSVTNSFGNSDTITKKNYVNTCKNCLLYRLPFPGGINMKITNGYGKDYHINKDYYCVDFNLTGESDAGIPVLAVADGIVTYAQWNTGGYGFRVVIDHGNGITSNYSHGASINVSKDEFVKQGQELMVIWDTGKSDGFHLHFGMRDNGESMPLPPFSGCTNGCSFNPIEANGYASDNVVNNPGKIIEEKKADISGSFDGNESYYGHDRKYSWKYAKEGTSTAIVTYRPRFSKKVSCDIFVYIPPFNATTTATKYKVKHVGGTETFTVNQFNVPASSIKPDNWVRLGDKTFEFGSGSYYYVQVGNGVDNYKKDQRVGFDAVYFKINESGGGGDPIGTPKIGLNRTTFNFGAIASGPTSDSDMLFINNTGKGTLKWTANSNASWLNISPKSGTNSDTINISVNSTGLYAGTYSGEITIADPNASNSPRTVSVTLKVYQWGWTGSPFGDFATPTDHSTVRSSIPVTGWALDDVGMESVKIYRTDGKNKVYIGDAVFVEGARPDVEQAYPTYPNNYKAGWGYMLLTNFLPNNGNGTFTLHAIAIDIEGNHVTLGTKKILVDNANAVKPFGAIDTPTQGGTASGSNYRNWGWVLTPQPNMIPTNGSTINVWVDGVKLGHPTYNIYRSDIASLFPGYANSNGAAGYFDIDTTAYDNGVHTIQWTSTNSGGNTDGIGSRYFTIQNTGSSRSSSASMKKTFAPGYNDLIDIPISYDEPVKLKKGCADSALAEDISPDVDGNIHIQCKELERIDIQVSRAGIEVEGYMTVGNRLMSLPVGSTLEKMKGRFHWIPGPGFVGTYSLIFMETNKYGEKSRKHILVTIDPKFPRE